MIFNNISSFDKGLSHLSKYANLLNHSYVRHKSITSEGHKMTMQHDVQKQKLSRGCIELHPSGEFALTFNNTLR